MTNSSNSFNDVRFWEVIDDARAGRALSADRLRAIKAQLTGWTKRELAEFQAVELGWSTALERRDLRAAADTLRGGCSDDSFLAFKTWLILQGRTALEEIVQQPDVLAGYKFVEDPTCEGLHAIANDISQEAFGAPLEELHYVADTSTWPADRVADDQWTPADCARLFPRIARRPLHKRKAKAPRKATGPSKYEVARAAAVGTPQPYTRDRRYDVGAVVEHPSLGVGVVTAVLADRVEVLFPDKARVLLHAPK